MGRKEYIVKEYAVNGCVEIDELIFRKSDGLITVVAQDQEDRRVLMVAYANIDSLRLTLSSGYAHYYSRSRGEIWKKGAQSGNVQPVSAVLVDCDADALLYIVDQQGSGACHTGAYSCFYRQLRKES